MPGPPWPGRGCLLDMAGQCVDGGHGDGRAAQAAVHGHAGNGQVLHQRLLGFHGDRKSTRLNSSHLVISYAVFCLKKKIPSRRATCTVLLMPTRSWSFTVTTLTDSSSAC